MKGVPENERRLNTVYRISWSHGSCYCILISPLEKQSDGLNYKRKSFLTVLSDGKVMDCGRAIENNWLLANKEEIKSWIKAFPEESWRILENDEFLFEI